MRRTDATVVACIRWPRGSSATKPVPCSTGSPPAFLRKIATHQAAADLRGELAALAPDTTDDLPRRTAGPSPTHRSPSPPKPAAPSTRQHCPDELAVSVITIGELRAGVVAATDLTTQDRRLRPLTATLELDPVAIDTAVAEHWAKLRVTLRASIPQLTGDLE
jgi:hypothetical protein